MPLSQSKLYFFLSKLNYPFILFTFGCSVIENLKKSYFYGNY
jgi:hypothetical protein